MSNDNPYAPPKADLFEFEELAKVREEVALADRSTRLVAQFVDGLITAAIAIPAGLMLGLWDDLRDEKQRFLLQLNSDVIGLFAYVLIHGYFLKRYGQTIGKKLCGIRIVKRRGSVPDLFKLIVLRYVPFVALSPIPVLGPLVSLIDLLFIFGADRRCIHDWVAGTWVVKIGRRGRGPA